MQDIQPSVTGESIVCAETQPPASGLIVFGASGDLTRRKLIVNVYKLFERGLITDDFYLLGCGRKKISDAEFQTIARESIRQHASDVVEDKLEGLIDQFYYISGDYDNAGFYETIKMRLNELDEIHSVKSAHVFYLAVPPTIYGTIADRLGQAGLSKCRQSRCEYEPRLVIEKPFGRDLKSAIELNERIQRNFKESQIYRIDHYLGKETVQNILMFRFANAIFEPIWNRNYIDNIQITIAESIGIEHRGGYYDRSGALRDMFQNHMLGMLALVAMEGPSSFQADHIRDEKVKLLRSIRKFDLDSQASNILRGRYAEGLVDGEKVRGYLQEEGVAADSKTETFVAAKLLIDNWRWQGVPFYLRTGKRLAKRVTEIAITFKSVPHSMFKSYSMDMLPENILILKIQPDEGITLCFQAKRPGSKACMGTLAMNFNYSDVFGIRAPQAYQRLLLDCMVGDQTLFIRQDDVEVSWQLMTNVLDAWERDEAEPYEYQAGQESFSQADSLLEADGKVWRKILEM